MEVLILIGLAGVAGGMLVWIEKTRPRPDGEPPPPPPALDRVRVDIGGCLLSPDPVSRTVASMAEGEWVLVEGRVEAGDALIEAPLTGERCIAWSARVKRGREETLRVLATGEGRTDAFLTDGDARVALRFAADAVVVLVDDFTSMFDGADRDRIRMRRFLEERGESLEVGQQEIEAHLLGGERVRVFGRVVSEAVTTGEGGGFRQAPRQRVLVARALEELAE